MTKATVLLVEDDPHTNARLADVIRNQEGLELAGACTTLAEAMQQLAATEPQVLLTDLELPDGNGITLIEAARKAGNTVSMVISVFGDERTVVKAIEAGAAGYLLKDQSAEDIGRSIHELIAGGSPVSPAIARYLLRRFQSPPMQPAPEGGEARPELTARETEVLRYISQGFTVAEIAKLVHLSPHTVSNHFRKIYRKLEVSSRTAAVYEAVQMGLIKIKE